jgi:hypothetical protein
MALQCFCWILAVFFIFLIVYTVGRTPWTRDQPAASPLPTHRTAQTQNKRTETSMPWVGIEPTIPAFERAKTVHTLGRAATVIGIQPQTLAIIRNVISLVGKQTTNPTPEHAVLHSNGRNIWCSVNLHALHYQTMAIKITKPYHHIHFPVRRNCIHPSVQSVAGIAYYT